MDYLKNLRVFYAARIILLGETEGSVNHRRYEDDKIEIALGQTLFPDDTVKVWLKDDKNTKVYEVALCPLPFSQKDDSQIYLHGRWEKYITEDLFHRQKEKIKKRFGKAAKNKIEDFAKFINNTGSIDNNIKIGEVDDKGLFD